MIPEFFRMRSEVPYWGRCVQRRWFAVSNEEGVDGGSSVTAPRLVACGCVVTAWYILIRRVRTLERRVDSIAYKAELARRDADRRFEELADQAAATAAVANTAAEVAKAAVEVVELQALRNAVQQMLRQAESLHQTGEPTPE
jgi:hypothetical protein